MRKILSTTLLLAAVLLAGCGQEKAQVATYINELQTSNKAMKATAEEMQKSMGGLQAEIASGKFDAEAVKAKIGSFEQKMKDEKARIEGLSVPEKAKPLHEAALKQYDTAITVLGKTVPMIDIAKKMADGAAKMKADPTKAKEVMAELKGAQEEMMGIQKEVMELAQAGQEHEKTAKEEQEKLAKEFGITIADESSDAATPAAESK